MTTEDVLQHVRDLVVSMTGLADDKVVAGNTGSPRRPKPYATVVWVSTRKLGIDSAYFGEVQGGEAVKEVSGERESTFSVQFYGAGAADYVEDLRAALVAFSALQAAEAAGYALVDVGSGDDLTRVVDTDFEDRAVANLRVRWQYTKQYVGAEAGGTIEKARVTGTVDGESADVSVDWP